MNKPNESAIQARDAARRIACSGELDDEALQAIVAGVIGEGTRSSHHIANLMADLTGKYPAACAAVAGLAVDPRPHVRRRAMSCIGRDTPHDLAFRLVEAGFTDQDAIVSHAAMNAAAAIGIFYPWSLACYLWGRGATAADWANVSAYHAQRDPTSAAAFAFVQEMSDGHRERPATLVAFLRQLASAGAEPLRNLTWLNDRP